MSGIYIVRFDENSIKIGMSTDVERRLKQYTGYQGSARPVQKLMIVYTPEYRKFEKMSHLFASDYGLPRILPYEIFTCAVPDEQAFLDAYAHHIQQKYSHCITSIHTTFEQEQPLPAQAPLPVSNLRFNSIRDPLLTPNLSTNAMVSFMHAINHFQFKGKSAVAVKRNYSCAINEDIGD